ncbi:MAG: hypothetical protein O3C43_19205 [Verrucomicrobia bacterium]|nr:hypothetical protein [Verrucomicrobiota bacterium]
MSGALKQKHSKGRIVWMVMSLIGLPVCVPLRSQAVPPFSGTIFLDPDIITSSDPTTFLSLTDSGKGSRVMFDRRLNNWVTLDAYLFNASYSDGPDIEMQVNPEFSDTAAARDQASKYAPVIGRLPKSLRMDVQKVWIHQGLQPFGGGNNSLLIHTGQADDYISSGILEETLVHEASHTSLDAMHASSPEWLAAQISDGEFISTYARDNPMREDVAETFLLYLALRHRSDRISQALAETISQTIPNRLAYFDKQTFDLTPLVSSGDPLSLIGFSFDTATGVLNFDWVSQPGKTYALDISTRFPEWSDFLSAIPAQGSTTHLSHDFILSEGQAFFRVREEE